MRKFPKFSDAGISVMSFSQKDRNKEHVLVFLPWHEIFLLDLLWSHWEETGVSRGRYMEGFQVVEMKKRSLQSSGRSGQLLPLLAESNKGKSWPSGLLEPWDPQCCFSMGSPWPWDLGEVSSLLHFHHGIAACPGPWQWVRLNYTKPPEKGILCSYIQIVFLWGCRSSP